MRSGVRSIAWLGLSVVITIDGQPTMVAALAKKYRIEVQQEEKIFVASRTAKVTQLAIDNEHKKSRPDREDSVRPPSGGRQMERDTTYDTNSADHGES